MKKKTRYVIVFACALFVLFLLWVRAWGEFLNAVSATLASRRSNGQEIVRYLDDSQNPLLQWPSDNGVTNFRSSTDLINAINEAQGKPHVAPDQNMWTIVKNLPSNAPNNFIVLATRNVDPKFLRSRLTEDQMDDKLDFLPKEKNGLLRKHFIIIRRDGSAFISKCEKTYRGAPFRDLYGNRPFDLTTNLLDGLPVKYLTPDGEVAP